LDQTYTNIEVLVIAHNSTDRTSEVAQIGDSRVRVFNLRTKEAGKSIALNYGIEQSKGEYILVLDADAVMANDFIEKALPMFDGNSCVAVQGRVLPINRSYNFLTRMMALEDDLWSEPILTVRDTVGKRCPLLGSTKNC
jgi:cellulose synthase/poly-beta-1,6-N-acetylglucosamine synthase-like glycosyltransferase